jgi:hypothetical protein
MTEVRSHVRAVGVEDDGHARLRAEDDQLTSEERLGKDGAAWQLA